MTFGRDYDQWLDEPYQRSCDYDEALENVKQRFLEGKCNPHNIDVFMDALAEGVLNENELKAAIALGESGYEQIGKVVWLAVYNYCDWMAKGLAIAELSRR